MHSMPAAIKMPGKRYYREIWFESRELRKTDIINHAGIRAIILFYIAAYAIKSAYVLRIEYPDESFACPA